MRERQVETVPLFDKQDLMERLDGDMELAGELVELFIVDVENKVNALRSALDRKDGAGIEKEAHSLKGAAANLSTNMIREFANQLEAAGRQNDFQTAEQLYRKLLPVIEKTAGVLKAEIIE